VSGSCEDHLAAATRRPRPRASPVQHLLLRLGVRRVLLQALGGGRGGVLAARGPLGGAERRVCTSRPGAPRTGSLLFVRTPGGWRRGAQPEIAHGVRVRRGGAGGGGRRAALFVQEGDGAVRNAARRVPRVAVCGLLDLPARGTAGLDKGPTVRARWRPRSEAAAVEVAQQTRPGSRHRHRGDIVHAVWAHRWSVVLEVYWYWY